VADFFKGHIFMEILQKTYL